MGACGRAVLLKFYTLSLFFFQLFKIQPSCRGLQWHSRTDQQPNPHRQPVQHQGQRQRPLHLQVCTARFRRYSTTIPYPCLYVPLLMTRLVKHFYPPPYKCPEVHFIFPLHQYKVTADLQLHIWVLHFTSLN